MLTSNAAPPPPHVYPLAPPPPPDREKLTWHPVAGADHVVPASVPTATERPVPVASGGKGEEEAVTAEAATVGERVGDTLADRERLRETEAEPVSEALPLRVRDADLLRLRETLVDDDGEAEPRADKLGDGAELPEQFVHGDAVAAGDGGFVALRDVDALGDGDGDGDGRRDALTDSDRGGDAGADAERDVESDGVLLAIVRDTVLLLDTVKDTDLEVLREGDTADGVKLADAEGVADVVTGERSLTVLAIISATTMAPLPLCEMPLRPTNDALRPSVVPRAPFPARSATASAVALMR